MNNKDITSTENRLQRDTDYRRNELRSDAVSDMIKEHDPLFSQSKFIALEKNIFMKIQSAWMARDDKLLRPFESDALYEVHKKIIQGYKDRKQINRLERVAVNFVDLVDFYQESDAEVLVTVLGSAINDYIVEEETGNVVKGDPNTRKIETYKLIFKRKLGALTIDEDSKINTTNCPNCGAPTKVTSSGRCIYCGSVITIVSYDWILYGIEKI